MDGNIESFEVGTFEWFSKNFFSLNKVMASSAGASEQTAYYHALRQIEKYEKEEKKLPGGIILTWEELLKRYADYLNYVKPLQNGTFTKKENQILTIEDYCYKEKFTSDYSSSFENPNDTYLFGI